MRLESTCLLDTYLYACMHAGHSAGAHLAWFGILNNSFGYVAYIATAIRCTLTSSLPQSSTSTSSPVGVVGIEGIYNVSLWEAYDSKRWHGQFRCATRKAFSSPVIEPKGWQDGSPVYLARTKKLAVCLALAHVAACACTHVPAKVPALLVHSPGDDWVQASQVSHVRQPCSC